MCDPPPERPEWCAWPRDVRLFADRFDACVHSSGEEAYDEDRRRFLEARVRESCPGNDKRLRKLKAAYADDAEISAVLAGFEGSGL